MLCFAATKTSQLQKKYQKAKRPRRRILLMLRALEIPRGGADMLNKRMLTVIHVLILVASFAVVAQAQDTPYRLNDKEVKRLLEQLKKDINRFLKNYENSTERLYSRFKDHKSVGADVEAVLDGANEIDQFMTRRLASERAERDWAEVRQDLRRLAEAYNVSWRWWS
jgi:hypothetical protein